MPSNSYVDQMDSVDIIEKYNPPPLMCLVEKHKGGMGVDEKVCVAMIAICPSSGDIVWDQFDGKVIDTSPSFSTSHFPKIHTCVLSLR
jgi:hypothetical protein